MVKPVLEEDEIFNSGEMREHVEALIARGYRNIAIDLESLEYLYSDTMNVILSLNRRILDSNGRLALLSPSDQVSQILDSSGVRNFMKVYSGQEDLIKGSEDIVMQTSSYNLAAIRKLQGGEESGRGAPAAEDTFAGAPRTEQGMPAVSRQQEPGYFQAPPPQQEAPEESFEVSAPEARQPAPPSRQQPPPSAPPREEPSFQPAPPPREERDSGYWPEAQQQERPQRRDRWEEVEEEKKGSPVGAIVLIILLLAVLGGAGYYFRDTILEYLPLGGPEVTEEEAPPAEIPQVSAEDEGTGAEEGEEAGEEAGEETEEETSAEVKKPAPAPKKPAARPARRATRRTRPKPRPPAPKPRRTVPKVNKLVIMSVPTGATVSIDGNEKGKTPYTWNNPDVYGAMRVSVSQPGYRDKSQSIEYTGGEKELFFRLDKEPEPVARPTPAPRRPPAPEPEPEPEPQAPPSPPPAAATPSPEPSPATPSTPPPSPPATASSGGGEPGTIFISSLPPIADVYMDGKLIGKTNRDELKIRSGTHTMRFVKGGKEVTKKMTFKPGSNPSQLIRIQ